MARGRRVFLLTLGIAFTAVTTAYFLFRPTWRTASQVEVEAILDPALVEREPNDPAAQARMRRIDAIIDKIDDFDVSKLGNPSKVAAYLKRERPDLQALERVLREGPLQVGDKNALDSEGYAYGSSAPVYRRAFLASISRVAHAEAKAGRPASGASLLNLALDLVNRLMDARGAMIGLSTEVSAETHVYTEIAMSLRWLDDAQLQALGERVPSEGACREAYRLAIRGEFQADLLGLIPDPIAALRREEPEVDPVALLAQRSAASIGGGTPALGNYDALETARYANRVFAVAMANAMRSRKDQDPSGERFAADLETSLPTYQGSGHEGVANRLRTWQYRWELVRIPNSTGRGLVGPFGLWTRADETLFGSLAEQNAIRILIALQRYRLRTGRRAASLDSLVKAHLLPALPSDPFGTGSLRYDPGRRRLWSVGKDGTDDGGVLPGPPPKSGGDDVWQTP